MVEGPATIRGLSNLNVPLTRLSATTAEHTSNLQSRATPSLTVIIPRTTGLVPGYGGEGCILNGVDMYPEYEFVFPAYIVSQGKRKHEMSSGGRKPEIIYRNETNGSLGYSSFACSLYMWLYSYMQLTVSFFFLLSFILLYTNCYKLNL